MFVCIFIQAIDQFVCNSKPLTHAHSNCMPGFLVTIAFHDAYFKWIKFCWQNIDHKISIFFIGSLEFIPLNLHALVNQRGDKTYLPTTHTCTYLRTSNWQPISMCMERIASVSMCPSISFNVFLFSQLEISTRTSFWPVY